MKRQERKSESIFLTIYRNERLTFQPLLTFLQSLFSFPQRLFPDSMFYCSRRRRFSWLLRGTLRVNRPPLMAYLCPPLLLSDSISQQAALKNRLHGGPHIVLATERLTGLTLPTWKHWTPCIGLVLVQDMLLMKEMTCFEWQECFISNLKVEHFAD